MKWKLIYPRSAYLLTDLHVRIMLLNSIWRLSPGSRLVFFFCGFFLSFKWNGNLSTLGLNTYWSVCIMLLKSIWSLSPGSWIVICGYLFKWNGYLSTLGLNTYWSVWIMLLKSIWSLSLFYGLVLFFIFFLWLLCLN